MISQQVQVAWSGAVCNQTDLRNWQNVIPYGGTKKDYVVIIRSHGSLTVSVTTGTAEHKQQINSLSSVY